MVQPMIFENKRVKKRIKIPRLKEICPGEKCYNNSGYFYIIYDNKGNAHPNVGEIDGELSEVFHKLMIKCYLSKDDSLEIIENILYPNIAQREKFANLVLELSALHEKGNKKIEEIQIEYDNIEKIFENYRKILVPQVSSCVLYKFCYYWSTLCIALDFREIDNKKSEDKNTIIGRSLMVRDAVAVIRQQKRRENFGKSWNEVIARVEPGETITSIKHIPVDGYEKTLNSDIFVNKKGEKISVEPCVKLQINKDDNK